MKKHDENIEKNLLEMVKQKEENDKSLLCAEIVIGILGLLPAFVSIIIVELAAMEEGLAAAITLASLIPFLIVVPFLLKIEQTAGYYECKKCNHKYVPTYKNVFWAMHYGRTRYMKCPKCNKRSWQKKVIRK